MATNRTASSANLLYLDGTRLSRALRAGISQVLHDADYLNKINVFPVPDGDTGTNLMLTLRAVLEALAQHPTRELGATMEVVADSALDGARGNSGAILAQFFHGLSDGTTGVGRWCTGRFSTAVQRGARYAREAMSDPREGTIITVIDEFAAEVHRQTSQAGGHDFARVLEKGLAKAKQALAHTTYQLEALRKAGVVDAGAKGFVDLLEGITDFILTGSPRDLSDPFTSPSRIHTPEEVDFAATETPALTHRFCTECVVVGENLDRRKIRESLVGLGSSLVIAGLRKRIRIHIHVNDPGQVFAIAAQHGEVQGTKADDMRAQQRSAMQQNRRVVIATDSAADLPDQVLEDLGIHMIPVRLHFGERSFLDKVMLTPEEFYQELKTNPVHPQTSQPAPGDLRRMFEFLAGHYEHVVSLHVTGKASGTFQAAQSAATRVSTPDSVTPMDSMNASAGQGLVVMYAAELAAAGVGPKAVIDGINRIIPLTRTYALLGNLDYAVKGGRVALSKKRIADFLRATPILKLGPGGSIDVGGMLFGRKDRLEKFVRWIARRELHSGECRVLIAQAQCPARAQKLQELLRRALPNIQDIQITQLGTALGVHGGPGTLVVAIQAGYQTDQTDQTGT